MRGFFGGVGGGGGGGGPVSLQDAYDDGASVLIATGAPVSIASPDTTEALDLLADAGGYGALLASVQGAPFGAEAVAASLYRKTSSPAVAGDGPLLSFVADNDAVAPAVAGGVSAAWSDPTAAAESADLRFFAANAGALAEVARLLGSGSLELGDGAAAPVSTAGRGALRYNAGLDRFEQSRNGGLWGALSGGTLDDAYDFGGPGAGRTITADAGEIAVASPAGALGGLGLAINQNRTAPMPANTGAICYGASPALDAGDAAGSGVIGYFALAPSRPGGSGAAVAFETVGDQFGGSPAFFDYFGLAFGQDLVLAAMGFVPGGVPEIRLVGANGVDTADDGGDVSLTPGTAGGDPGTRDGRVRCNGATTAQRPVEPHTTSATLDAADSRTCHTNEGAVGPITLTLPTAPAVGTELEVAVVDGQDVEVGIPVGASVFCGTTLRTSATPLHSAVPGSRLCLTVVAADTWLARVSGDWDLV